MSLYFDKDFLLRIYIKVNIHYVYGDLSDKVLTLLTVLQTSHY